MVVKFQFKKDFDTCSSLVWWQISGQLDTVQTYLKLPDNRVETLRILIVLKWVLLTNTFRDLQLDSEPGMLLVPSLMQLRPLFTSIFQCYKKYTQKSL